MKIILHKGNKKKTLKIEQFICVFFCRIPIVKSARRTTTGAPTNEAAELSVPNNVLVKFRKSCAAYCTAGFVIGLGKFFIRD
jgi:hypothetical protein